MEIPPLQRAVKATDLPVEKLAGSTQLSDQEKVAEVSRHFEAILLRQILRDAQKTVFASTMNPDSVSGNIYQDMIVNQMAENISQSKTFGLARCLEKQLAHQVLTPKPPSTEPLAASTSASATLKP